MARKKPRQNLSICRAQWSRDRQPLDDTL